MTLLNLLLIAHLQSLAHNHTNWTPHQLFDYQGDYELLWESIHLVVLPLQLAADIEPLQQLLEVLQIALHATW
jgi:hypothetical protein